MRLTNAGKNYGGFQISTYRSQGLYTIAAPV